MITNFNNTRKDLAEKIDFQQLFTNLETGFLGIKTGDTVQPSQLGLIAPNNDDCIIYPAADFANNIVGVKLSPFIASKISKNENPVTAYTFLLSMLTGQPIIVCDSFHLTAIRTAATSVLAVSKLKPKLNKLAIIGFGPIGQEHLRCSLLKFNWDNISIFSPSISKDKSKGIEIINSHNLNPNSSDIGFSDSIEESISNADVIMLCTSSKTEILDLSITKNSCIVTSIVTNSPTAHEVKPNSLIGCDVYCDLLPNTLEIGGEFKILKESGKLKDVNILGDLSSLCEGKTIIDENKRRYFRSVGLGIEDIIIANCLL